MKDQEVIDYGWEDYLRELDDKLSYVDVGILSSNNQSSESGKITLAELASVQEFGISIAVTPKMRAYLRGTGLPLKPGTTEITIPERPFMRQTFDEQLPQLEDMADKLEREILTKKKTKRLALSELGQAHRQQIQANMADAEKFEPNHPYTLEKKAPKTTPLIGKSGRLRQAIDFEVG